MSDKVKTLSEAIRLGATFRPQIRAACFRRNGSGALGSCALGAAYEAVYGLPAEPEHMDTAEAMVLLRERFPDMPQDTWIVDGNDSGMTREEIAAKLEAWGL